MIITSTGGVKVETRRKSEITFEKIGKRWHVVYLLAGTGRGTTLKVPVRHTASIKAGGLK